MLKTNRFFHHFFPISCIFLSIEFVCRVYIRIRHTTHYFIMLDYDIHAANINNILFPVPVAYRYFSILFLLFVMFLLSLDIRTQTKPTATKFHWIFKYTYNRDHFLAAVWCTATYIYAHSISYILLHISKIKNLLWLSLAKWNILVAGNFQLTVSADVCNLRSHWTVHIQFIHFSIFNAFTNLDDWQQLQLLIQQLHQQHRNDLRKKYYKITTNSSRSFSLFCRNCVLIFSYIFSSRQQQQQTTTMTTTTTTFHRIMCV